MMALRRPMSSVSQARCRRTSLPVLTIEGLRELLQTPSNGNRLRADIVDWAGPRIMESLEPIHEIENRTDLDDLLRRLLLSPLVLGRNSAHTAAARNLAIRLCKHAIKIACLGPERTIWIMGSGIWKKRIKACASPSSPLNALSSNAGSLPVARFCPVSSTARMTNRGGTMLPQGLIQPSSDAWGGRARERDQLVQQLSRRTIIEAQKLMARRGFYTAAIDGIPGPRFSEGLTKMVQLTCSLIRQRVWGTTKLCISSTDGSLISADWARPYRTRSLGRIFPKSDPHCAPVANSELNLLRHLGRGPSERPQAGNGGSGSCR